MAFKTRPLSEDQMRRIWALIDILTSLKRRANHPPKMHRPFAPAHVPMTTSACASLLIATEGVRARGARGACAACQKEGVPSIAVWA